MPFTWNSPGAPPVPSCLPGPQWLQDAQRLPDPTWHPRKRGQNKPCVCVPPPSTGGDNGTISAGLVRALVRDVGRGPRKGSLHTPGLWGPSTGDQPPFCPQLLSCSPKRHDRHPVSGDTGTLGGLGTMKTKFISFPAKAEAQLMLGARRRSKMSSSGRWAGPPRCQPAVAQQ